MSTSVKELRFGVELETVYLSREQCARVIQTVVGGEVSYEGGYYDKWICTAPDGRVWTAMSDASLSTHYSAEVVSPILTWADFDALQSIVRALRSAGAKIDSSCGMHVHVDGAPFLAIGPKAVGNLVKVSNKYHSILMLALGVSGERLSQYCKPIPQAFVRRICRNNIRNTQALAAAWYQGEGRRGVQDAMQRRTDHYDPSRYHGVNLHSLFFRGTIEFRWFDGTLHAGKVKANVQLCLALACKALNSGMVKAAPRPTSLSTLRFDIAGLINTLDLKGDDFKTVRHHLTSDLPAGTASLRDAALLASRRKADRIAARRLAREEAAMAQEVA